MRKFSLLLALALAAFACPKLSASPPTPKPFSLVLHAARAGGPDTLVATFSCTGAAPNTGCLVSGNAVGGALALPASLAVGQQGTATIVCASPNSTVTFTGSLVGTALGYSNSAPVSLTDSSGNTTITGHCPAKAANTPGQSVVTAFTVHSGGL